MKYRISILALTMAANAGLCAYAADDRPNQRYNMQDVTDTHGPGFPIFKMAQVALTGRHGALMVYFYDEETMHV